METFTLFSLHNQLDNHEMKPGKPLKVNISVPNLRLFVGNIPKSKGKEEIMEEFSKLAGNRSIEAFHFIKTKKFGEHWVLVF